MIKEMTMYTVVCDACGVSADNDTDYCAWATEDEAWEQANHNGYEYINDTDTQYCPECRMKMEGGADE